MPVTCKTAGRPNSVEPSVPKRLIELANRVSEPDSAKPGIFSYAAAKRACLIFMERGTWELGFCAPCSPDDDDAWAVWLLTTEACVTVRSEYGEPAFADIFALLPHVWFDGGKLTRANWQRAKGN